MTKTITIIEVWPRDHENTNIVAVGEDINSALRQMQAYLFDGMYSIDLLGEPMEQNIAALQDTKTLLDDLCTRYGELERGLYPDFTEDHFGDYYYKVQILK